MEGEKESLIDNKTEVLINQADASEKKLSANHNDETSNNVEGQQVNHTHDKENNDPNKENENAQVIGNVERRHDEPTKLLFDKCKFLDVCLFTRINNYTNDITLIFYLYSSRKCRRKSQKEEN